MQDVYIVGAVRTPIGKYGGALAPLKAVDLGVIVAEEVVRRAGVPLDRVDEVIFGCARQSGVGPNPARQIAVRTGLPSSTTAYTINKACGSGLKAVLNGYTSIVTGDNEVVLAGGIESMSNIPYLLMQGRWGYRMGHGEVVDANHLDGYFCPMADKLMGATAEDLADRYGIGREEQDTFALQSQHRAESAIRARRFDEEIVPVDIAARNGTVHVQTDEHPRLGCTLEDLRKLNPVFRKNGTITAGSSSGVTDGASALILAGEQVVKRLNLIPMARVVAHSSAGVEPSEMGIAPVPAVRKLLKKTSLGLDLIDLVEINEAFAAQVLACDRELKFDWTRTNVNGGAISLGHPTGCTGARITTTLLYEMLKRKSKLGLATLCISGGLGLALLMERV